jgi:hypothetical protein
VDNPSFTCSGPVPLAYGEDQYCCR